MFRSTSTTALLGALLIAVPLGGAAAQTAQSFTLKVVSDRDSEADMFAPPWVDPLRLRGDTYEKPLDLFGIPLTTDEAANRERGLSFTVRPVKGVRAMARLRF